MGGVWRSFCCSGCEAAAFTITGLGLEDYYRLREQTGTRPESRGDRFAPYDDPLFQASFARDTQDGAREAALLLEGIRCSACLWLIEERLKRIPGVRSIDLNYVTRRVVLRWHPQQARLSEVLQSLGALGYGAHPYRPEHVDAVRRAEKRQGLWRLFVAAFGMMQVMMYAVPVYIAGEGEMSSEHETLMRWASFALTLPVVLYSAQPFFAGARHNLRTRRLGMDLPVALGIAIAFAASSWATFAQRGEVYFDSLTMFVFLLLLGRYLEMRARDSAGHALAHLARLAPALAQRLKNFPASRESESVAVAQLRSGDIVLVKPGESIAADGCVLEGRSAVNEALLSGESIPVSKAPGAQVTGGSVNIESPLLVRVERVGEAGTLAAIVRLAEGAAAQKQPLAENADRYAQKFVWLIFAVTLAAALYWLWADPARAPWIVVSLLVATCPCALSLATPVALTVATGRLAGEGMIVTRGHAIETLARATDFVFDKTGTLTEGKLSVIDFSAREKIDAAQCLGIAAALESASEHPIGKAVRAYAQNAGVAMIDADGRRSEPGAGVEARIDGKLYRLGRFEFCAALSPQRVIEQGLSSYTRVWLTDEKGMLAHFDLSDSLKAGARDLISALHAAGKKVHLLSGDSAGPVQAVARELDIGLYRAGASPAAKQDYVASLQRQGAHVVMIGDGVNDAPVLACADVSIAMGDGALLAQSRADAVLLSGRPQDLLRAWRLSRRSLYIVRQNLFWAFAYNFAVIPLAATGLINPWVAGAGMSASSLLVVFNALRLRSGKS